MAMVNQGFRLRPDLSSGRFSLHARYFDNNIWEFFAVHFHSITFYFLKRTLLNSSPAWETLETAFLSAFGARKAPYGAKTNFTSGAFTMSATL